MNFNITRRQFLQYCTASAAALGLSQTDLLKLEKALATPATGCGSPSPSVIWLSGQACSGCPVSLLNRLNKEAGVYYDADMLNQLYGTSLTTPSLFGDDALGLPLQVVNDAADLLVGDGVRALTGITRTRAWADDVGGHPAIAGSLLDAYAGAFPKGYITLEWNATVMASAGDVAVDHLNNIVNGSGSFGAGVFVLLVDGAVPTGPGPTGTANEEFCMVFDDPSNYSGFKGVDVPANPSFANSVNMANALRWIANSPNCVAVISVGTCSSYGGIPAGKGNKTGAMGVYDFFQKNNITTPVINVPGCPPHPDWIVYPVAYFLAHTPGDLSSLGIPPLDIDRRPTAVYSGSDGQNQPFCYDCPNQITQGTTPLAGPNNAAAFLGDEGCLGGFGCKGPYTVGDCPIRGKNTSDDGLSMNWCVGASGSGAPSGVAPVHVGDARHPCQGCIQPDFPDWAGLTTVGSKTTKKVKGFYND